MTQLKPNLSTKNFLDVHAQFYGALSKMNDLNLDVISVDYARKAIHIAVPPSNLLVSDFGCAKTEIRRGISITSVSIHGIDIVWQKSLVVDTTKMVTRTMQ